MEETKAQSIIIKKGGKEIESRGEKKKRARDINKKKEEEINKQLGMLHMVLEDGKREKVLFSCFLAYIKLPWSQEHRQPFYKEEFLEREQTAPGWLSATYDPPVCLNNNNDEEKGNQG